MKFKERLNAVFLLWLIFGGLWCGFLFYISAIAIGHETEKNYLKVFGSEIHDTIENIGELLMKDYAYVHRGGIKTIELKSNKEITFALYLETPENIGKIKIGDKLIKEKNSRIITIKSNEESFNIVLRDLKEMRKHKRRNEAIKWIIAYIIIGTILIIKPVNLTKFLRGK
jgi:hypothetical protein